MITQNSEYRGVNRITRDDFRALLTANAAPAVLAERDPGEYWDAIQRYDADALFIAAIFMHESQMGKKGTATQTHSWGNTRTPNFGAQSVGTVPGRSGTFPVFKNWLDGCISTVARLTDPTWVYAKGDRTIGEVFTVEPSWAPAGDMNDPEGYLRAVLDFMNAHKSKGDTPVAITDDSVATWQKSPNYGSGRAGETIDFIILHTTEGTYDSALGWLRNPASQASCTYLASADGTRVAQLVREADTSWAAGNLDFNRRGINIEQEGWAAKGEFSDALYQTIGGLVGRIARRHNIPLEYTGKTGKRGIIGHMDVPDGHGGWGGQSHHGDPGPHYDFARVIAIAKGGQTATPQQAAPAERVDPKTGFAIIGGIRAYIEALEAEIGPEKALMLIGRPISNEYDTDYGRAQDFERQRLEWHKGARPQDFDILPGLVNAELLAAKAQIAKLKATQ